MCYIDVIQEYCEILETSYIHDANLKNIKSIFDSTWQLQKLLQYAQPARVAYTIVL